MRGQKRFPSGIMDAYRAYLVLVGQEYGNRQMVVYLRTTPKAEEYCETKIIDRQMETNNLDETLKKFGNMRIAKPSDWANDWLEKGLS